MSAAPARNSKRWFWPVIIGGVAIVAILAIVLGSRGGDGGRNISVLNGIRSRVVRRMR